MTSMENEANSKTATLRRLKRIEGQVRGVANMIEQDRYCIEILQQIQAVKAAFAKVEDAVLKDHAATCVESAIASGSAQAQREKFDELIELFARTKR